MRTFLIAAALILVSSVRARAGRGQPGLRQIREPSGVQRLPRQAGTEGGRDARRPRIGRPRARSARRPSGARRSLDARLRGPKAKQWPGPDGVHGHAAIERRASTIGREYEPPLPPSFSPSFSKSRLFCSKLFQTFLWRFCGISRGYKASKPTLTASKFFGPRSAEAVGRAAPRRGGADDRREPRRSRRIRRSESERIVRGT